MSVARLTTQERRQLIDLLIDYLDEEDREELVARLRSQVPLETYFELKDTAVHLVAVRNDMADRMDQYRKG